MLVGQEALHGRIAHDREQERHRDVACQQALPALGEHRHVPDGHVHRQADESLEQHVLGDLLHQLALWADAVEGMEEQGSKQLLRRDRGAPTRSIEPGNSGESRSSAAFTSGRIERSGWSGGTSASGLR